MGLGNLKQNGGGVKRFLFPAYAQRGASQQGSTWGLFGTGSLYFDLIHREEEIQGITQKHSKQAPIALKAPGL